MKTPKEFIEELKERFRDKKPFLLHTDQQNSVFDTILAYLQKKQLVVISRVEYETLIKACQDKKADEIIDKILSERP
jgi:peptidase E